MKNYKMAKNNFIRIPKRRMKNTKGIKLDMIFNFFGAIRGTKRSRLGGLGYCFFII
jgi:hypothetical protein